MAWRCPECGGEVGAPDDEALDSAGVLECKDCGFGGLDEDFEESGE